MLGQGVGRMEPINEIYTPFKNISSFNFFRIRRLGAKRKNKMIAVSEELILNDLVFCFKRDNLQFLLIPYEAYPCV